LHDPAAGGDGRELAKAADRLSVIPGLLGLHQEFGALLARQLLESGLSAG